MITALSSADPALDTRTIIRVLITPLDPPHLQLFFDYVATESS